MDIKTYASMDEVDAQAWNAVGSPDRLICQAEYLKAVEQSQINDCRFFYPVVYENGKMVAHTCLYFISTELDAFAQGATKAAVDIIRKFWKNFFIMRSLECGTPVALGNTISLLPGIDREACLELLLDEADRIADCLGVKILLFRDFYDENLSQFERFRERGYTLIRNLPTAHMDLPWKSFDSYLDAMRSPYRRKALMRLDQTRKAGVQIEVCEDFGPWVKDLARLWKNSYENAREYRREMLYDVFFEKINRYLGKKSQVILATKDGHAVGFALLLCDATTLDWLFCGLDYFKNKDCGVYFSILYRIVEFGIRNGFKKVDLGITTLEPKMDIGAKVVSQYMFMKHRKASLQKIVPFLFSIMTPRARFIDRRVFKN